VVQARGDDPLLVVAGDIACKPGASTSPVECRAADTARVIDALDPDLVMPLGDLQYELGKSSDFAAGYDANWGRFKAATRPVPGNHEYTGGKAAGYFATFGSEAHPPAGWYSFDTATWHIVALNSVCSAVGGCGADSEEYRWLVSDLAATKQPCILAAWHHPRWSSGLHHSDATYQPFWDALAAKGADVVVSGHDHDYERFAPIQGIREFVAGTGGRSLYTMGRTEAGSEMREDASFGVLGLNLRPAGYDWTFHAVEGSSFADTGSARCRPKN